MSTLGKMFMFSWTFFVLLCLYLCYGPNLAEIHPYVKDVKYFRGPIKMNEDLSKAEKITGLHGPESIVIHKGVIHTGLHTGEIMTIKGNTRKTLGTIAPNSRVLGLRLHKDKLLACDAFNGLYQVDLKTSKAELLFDSVDNKKMLFPDDVDVAVDGTIYLSDASQRWDYRHTLSSFMEHENTGRIIAFDPKTKQAKTIVDGLKFANGVQISHDQKSLLIGESMEHRIMKYHLEGSKKGQLEIFSAVPGEPDNIRPSSTGGYWVGLNRLVDYKTVSLSEKLFTSILLRKAIVNFFYLMGNILERINDVYPTLLMIELEQNTKQMKPLLTGLAKRCAIVELGAKGNIIRILQSSDTSLCGISEVAEHEGHLYLGYYANHYLAKLKL